MSVIEVNFRTKNVTTETILSYSASEIVSALIELNTPDLTPMKIQKLLFFAHGWYLGLTGKPLINENFEAWEYGPVVPEIYHQYKSFSNNVISITDNLKSSVDEKTLEFLRAVKNRYGDKSAITLSNLTHQVNTPWYIAKQKRVTKIDNISIENYFRGLLHANQK